MAADWDLALAWLYVPATRADRFAKAAAAADGVVIDLEDAVHPAQRPSARAGLADAIGDGLAAPTVVRVNPPSHPDFEADIEAVAPLVRAGLVSAIRVAKADSVPDVARAAEATADWGVERRLILQLETARAIAAAHDLADHRAVHSLMLGEADLRADLGLPRGVASDDGLALSRQTAVLASRAAGLPSPVGSAYVNVTDLEGLRADSLRQRALGFLGRSCIHPRQVAVVREAFAPTPADIEWADSILDRAVSMAGAGSGVATLADGSFIDAPVVRQAERVRALAERQSGADRKAQA